MYVITTALMWSVGGSEASHYCHFKATFTRYLSLFTLFSKCVSRSMFPRLILPSPLSLSLSVCFCLSNLESGTLCHVEYIWSVVVL